jgi:hypothetical protein
MSDPLPAVTEAQATGEIADIFADIRQVYRVSVVNLIWRHLATLPGALPWVWASVRSLYLEGTLEIEAAALRASVPLKELPRFPPAVLAAAGLGTRDLEQIRSVSPRTTARTRWRSSHYLPSSTRSRVLKPKPSARSPRTMQWQFHRKQNYSCLHCSALKRCRPKQPSLS